MEMRSPYKLKPRAQRHRAEDAGHPVRLLFGTERYALNVHARECEWADNPTVKGQPFYVLSSQLVDPYSLCRVAYCYLVEP